MTQHFIGLMSGTSADGVDAALVEINAEQIKLIDFYETPLPESLKSDLLELNQSQQIDLYALSKLHKEVADIFIVATKNLLQKNNLTPEQIQAIGSHGQTIFHAPDIPMTLQIGHPAFIAKQTGITTVGDFRVDDMALGGQGAPFAPALHQQLFSDDQACFVVNIGGIANLTYIDSITETLKGWDTGPGNGIMDEICQRHFQQDYDKNGDLAQQGKVNQTLLEKLLQHPYFAELPPKSTGRDIFRLDWIEQTLSKLNVDTNPNDLLATATELTAITIAKQIKSIEKSQEPVWIVGGGAYNPFLIDRIQANLQNHKVASSQQKNINPSAVEAMLCAWLADQRINNKPINLVQVTGAKRNAILGGIWHP